MKTLSGLIFLFVFVISFCPLKPIEKKKIQSKIVNFTRKSITHLNKYTKLINEQTVINLSY